MCGLYSLPRSGIRIVSGKVVYYVKDIPTLNTLDDREWTLCRLVRKYTS